MIGLFDIAHQDALAKITINEDKEFLKAQREKVRRGCMGTKDMSLTALESRKQKKEKAKLRYRKKTEIEQQILNETAQLTSSNSSSAASSPTRSICQDRDSDNSPGPSTSAGCPPLKRRRASTKLVNTELSIAMDRTKVSDRNAVYVLAAAARSLGHKPEELVINRESFRKSRKQFRNAKAAEIRAAFAPTVPLTVHWDGKIVPDVDGGPPIDRLPVLVTGDGVSKLLAVPKLDNGTGQAAADAVLAVLGDWGVKEQVCALSFDTTASNTGRSAGACTIIEQLLERDMLHLACRHHVYELVLEKAMTVCLGPSSGPDVQLFKRFKMKWPSINGTNPKPFDDGDMQPHLYNTRDNLLAQFSRFLDNKHPRDDYRELLELSIIVLGGIPKRGVRINRPGALHRARWMAKAIYLVKIYLFRTQFRLTASEKTGIQRAVTFVVSTYVMAWFKATLPASAPAQDLGFLKSLLSYKDKLMSKATATVFGRHLWYLGERLVPLAFFDDEVTLATKRDMVKALREEEGAEDPPRRANVELTVASVSNKTVANFVTTGSASFFALLGLETDFLSKDPAYWEEEPSYNAASRRIKSLHVVNDFAERGVALMQEFNLALTKDEGQKQFLLQVVEDHRRRFSNANKSTVTATK